MKRRTFISLLSGAAAAWPLAARAQRPEQMRRIGVLMSLAADDPEGKARLAAFVQRLQELGWSDGRNVRTDYRWAVSDAERTRYAAELVALAPDVILATSGATVGALLGHSRPIGARRIGRLCRDPNRHGDLQRVPQPLRANGTCTNRRATY